MEWQPIETAPKDGTRILVTGDHVNFGLTVAIAAWNDYSVWECEAIWINKTTHWMPLPAPPK